MMRLCSLRCLSMLLLLICLLSFSVLTIANESYPEVESYLQCRAQQKAGKRLACPVPPIIKASVNRCKDLQSKGYRIACLGD